MKYRWKRALTALLITVLTALPMQAALGEENPETEIALAGEAAVEAEVFSESDDTFETGDAFVPEDVDGESELSMEVEMEPEVALATDSGDTGLSVEIEEAMPDGQPENALPAPPEEEAGQEAVPEDEVPADEAPAEGAVLAGEEAHTGYVAVALEAVVYADAGLSQPLGTFPQGATAYACAVEGAALRIRFDTEAARAWAEEAPGGYVAAEETLNYSDDEAAALVAALEAAGAREAEGALLPLAVYEPLEQALSAPEDGAVGLNVTYRSQAEIQAFCDAHPSYRYQANLYSVAPTDSPYTVGYLSPVNQASVLNIINQVRYIAGLDADVSLYGDVEYQVAAASLVLRLNGALSHYPPRPDALSDSAYDALYKAGYSGSGRSNIAKGYTATSAILAYIADADDTNREKLGHRRWILNPRLARTVAGANGRYSAMYAHDRSGAGGQTKVAWPGQETPYQYFSAGDPWSLSYGRALSADKVTVDLVRQGDGRSWHFSKAQSDGYFNVDNVAYGQSGCVIFQPAGLDDIAPGDAFNVSVDDGTGEITRYTVRFFSLDRSASEPLSKLDVTAVKTDGGVQVSWSGDSRATGYYVCRLNDSRVYEIIADVAGNSFLDTSVPIANGVNYYYRVYAHTDCLTSSSAADVKSGRQPDGVTLDRSGTVTLYTNATLQLTAAVQPACADTGLSWTSKNEKVATVDENGLVKPVNKGTTYITVRTDNNLSAKVKVKVAAPPKPTKVRLSAKGTVSLNLGEKLTLTATLSPEYAESALTWSTSDKKVAKVSQKGVVTARKEGTAIITVKTANDKKASVKVKVVDPKAPTSVKLDASGTVKLYVGDKLTLAATIKPDTAAGAKLTWSTSNSKVAKVSKKGVVTARKKGTATITVKTANGKSAKVKIKVLE